MAHDALFVAIPVAVFFRRALVVLLFAGGNRDFTFNVRAFPVHSQGDAGTAFLLGGFEQFADFTAMQQQFTRA